MTRNDYPTKEEVKNRITHLRQSHIQIGYDKPDLKASSAMNFHDVSKKSMELNNSVPPSNRDQTNIKMSTLTKSEFEELPKVDLKNVKVDPSLQACVDYNKKFEISKFLFINIS